MPNSPPPLPPAAGLQRILIVDDEPRNLALLEALLSSVPVEMHRASGGREAIESFTRMQASGGFDLVLLDVMMPEVDGLTALAAMRAATASGERVPIVLVTALGAREDRLRGLEAGADDFLTKPLDPNEVRCRVRTFLALHAAQRTLRLRALELEQLHVAKAELTRMIVHDLKNPLSVVASNVAWILKRAAKLGVADPDLLGALDDAQEGTTRLLALIQGLVEIEKAETGQLAVRRRSTSLDSLLEGVARRNRMSAEERTITLTTTVAEGGDRSASIDPELLARVLENLVENAIRYAGAGGRISLTARRSSNAVELVVANTGKPIPVAERARIFDKHVSGEDRGARGANLGLGLYFCRLAAKVHGGTIAVDSTDEWPTRFVVTLPLELPLDDAKDGRPSPAAAPRAGASSAFLD